MNLRFLLSIAAAAWVSVNVHAAEIRPFERMDVFDLEWVSSPKISPDGKKVVYVRNGMDVMKDEKTTRLWIINSDGSGSTPLTGEDRNESNAAWSPDNSRIAFTTGTNHGSEIFIYWLKDGKSTRLTQLPRSPSGITWSPDGKQLAFSMLVPESPQVLVTAPEKPKDAEWADAPKVTTRLSHEKDGSGFVEPGFNHYFVMSALGGAIHQVSSGDFHHRGGAQWSSDGKYLFFSANRNDDWELNFVNSDIYKLSVGDGSITALTDRNGPDEEVAVSPDGQRIAYIGFEDKVQTYQVTRLQVMNSDGSDKRVLLEDFDRSVSGITWDGDSDGIFFQYNDLGDTKIGYTSLSGKHREVVGNVGGVEIGRPYSGGSFSVSGNNRIAFTYGTAYRPAELAVSDRSGHSRVITAFSESLLKHRDLGQLEEVWYKSSVDGRDIQGWLVRPPGYDSSQVYPLLVENHGGPIANYGPWFSPEIQLYAAAGYMVFYPNPRGSTSYGEEFGNLLFENYPGDDYQDVMDGVASLIAAGVASEDQLYVTGGSAGGIMTAWIIGNNNRFKAAAVVKPVMNWISKTLTADNYYMYSNYRYPGQPWENIETYMKFSPISLVGNIETPTMVMVGTADLRTPLSEAKQLYHALKIRGIDTALVEVPDASHFIANRPSQLITKVDHILAWFARYRVDP